MREDMSGWRIAGITIVSTALVLAYAWMDANVLGIKPGLVSMSTCILVMFLFFDRILSDD